VRWFLSDQVKSMSQDNEAFGPLRRLLVLKRYEQPPPGYFNNFSSQVIARIEAGEGAREGALQQLLWGATWLQRLWNRLETKPILASSFGAAACAMFAVGVVYCERPEPRPALSGPATTSTHHLQLAHSRSSSDQGPFDRYPRLSDPAVEGIPEATGILINVNLPDAN
jgi:hypothetical protein